MTEVPPNAVGLDAVGADVGWPDAAAVAAAREAACARPGARPDAHRLDELVEWLAGCYGEYPPHQPRRARCVVFGPTPDSLPALASSFDFGVSVVGVDDDASTDDAFEFGCGVADDEADSGTDLAVVADPGRSAAAAVAVALLTGTEPVALLPRGADAVDTASWIEQAVALRDGRRGVASLRNRPAELLAALGCAPIAATLGFVLRSAGRRTPMLLDGTSAVVAGLLAADVQSDSKHWWRIADAGPDPVHARAAAELEQQPLMTLGLGGGDGTAGVLAACVVRAATLRVSAAKDDGDA